MNTSVLILVLLAQSIEKPPVQRRDSLPNEVTRLKIRQIDFANYSYTIPERDPDRDPTFAPLSTTGGTRVRLKSGKYLFNNPVGRDWVAVSLHFVSYGDVTDDGREEAIVALRVQSGGTQSWGLLLIYGSDRGKVHLLQTFWTGDHGNEGLHRAYAERGSLLVEIYDPESSLGDCCPTRVNKVRLRWNGAKFQEADRETATVQPAR